MKKLLNWLRPSNKTIKPELIGFYNLLFGDAALDQWPRPEATGRDKEPWKQFVQAQEAAQRGEQSVVIERLQQVLNTPMQESRHYLQAWEALRTCGVQPSAAETKQVLGVIVEVALEQGPDVLAAYADGTARYLNQSGKIIVLEKPDASLDPLLGELLAAGQHLAHQIGPWEEPRLAPPTGKLARITMLTPSGLHFGQGPMDSLWNDALAHPVLAAAQALMIALMEKSQPGITRQN